MESESLARNHFQAVVRDGRGLYFLKVSRKFNDKDRRYRASNKITILYIISQQQVGSESSARNHFLDVVRGNTGLKFLKVSRKFNDTDLRYRASNINTMQYIMLVGAHFKSAVGWVRETSP